MKDKDFKIVSTCGTGPGGQHRNRHYTAITVTHIPTGLKEKCEDSRSALKNKNLAMERLIKKIEDKKISENHEKQNDFRKELLENNKTIRTYNYPRNQVIDHRTGKRANLKKFLNGDLNLLNK